MCRVYLATAEMLIQKFSYLKNILSNILYGPGNYLEILQKIICPGKNLEILENYFNLTKI